MALSLVIGALTGLSVVAFIVLTERIGMRLYPVQGAPWRRLLFPVVGSLCIGYLLYRFFPNARGSGVPQTKAALFARDGRITLRTVLGKFFHLGDAGQRNPAGTRRAFGAGRRGNRFGVGTRPGPQHRASEEPDPGGCGSGHCSRFQYPSGCSGLALEEIMGDLNAPMMGGVVLASATAWMVLRVSLGDHPLFNVPQYHLVSSAEFAVYAVLGVAGGVVSAAFSRLLLGMRAWFLRLPRKTVWFQPVAGGLLVGAMGWFVPQVLGVGYGFVGDALNGRMAFHLMLLLLLLKLFAVTTSYASGNAAGIFGPSLLLGAMLGGVVGTAAHHLLPAGDSRAGSLRAGGHGSGLRRSGAHAHDLGAHHLRDDPGLRRHCPPDDRQPGQPLRRLAPQHEPIYEALAVQDGIHLPSARTRLRLDQRTVAEIMKNHALLLESEITVREALARIRASGLRSALVTNRSGVIGVITQSQMEIEVDEDASKLLDDLMNERSFPTCMQIRGWIWPWSAWAATRSICCR